MVNDSHRPLGSNVTDIVARSFTVADLVNEPLLVVPSSTSSEEARHVMQAQGFDVLGVHTTAKASADRWVRITDLEDGQSVWKVSHPLLANEAVERSMPLVVLLDLLIDRDHVFVLDGDTVRHIVTRADVAKPPVSVLTLTYLLALESDLIRLSIPRIGSDWFRILEGRQEMVMKIYNKRAKNNSELGLEACLYFDDSVLLARNAPGLLDELGLAHKRFTVLGESMAGLRNDLAHGGTIIDRADSPVTALRTLRDVRELAHRAAGLASQEPDRPELYSQTTIVDEDGRFYGGGAQVVEMGDGDVFYVLTAYNAGGRTQPEARNARAQSQLQSDLDRAGLRAVSVTGMSTDGRWKEPSLLFSSDRQSALDLGVRYGQVAIFELTSRFVRVLDCTSGDVRFEGPRELRPSGS